MDHLKDASPMLRGGVRAAWLVALLAGCGSSGSGAAPSAEAGPLGPPGKIYVTMYGDDEITVFDQSTLTVLSHIPVGKGPAVMVATPDNTKLYTANWADNTISAVDIATATVKSIPLSGRPWGISMSPVGHTLFAGLSSNAVAKIDTTMDAVSSTFDTSPDFPQSVVVSGDGSAVYVAPTPPGLAGASAGTLESLSAADGSVLQPPIMVGQTPAFASLSPDGSRAYTLNFLPGTVSVVDTKSWTVMATVSTGSGSQPIISSSTPDGLLVVTNFGTASLETVDFATNQVVHTLSLDGRPVGVGGYDSTGTLGYICDFGHASLAVTDSLTNLEDFLNGDLTPFVGQGPGHLTPFNPATGERVGSAISVGAGPTSIVVVAP